MNRKVFRQRFLQMILLLSMMVTFTSAQAVKIIPRIGVAGGILFSEDNISAQANSDQEPGVTSVFGINGGTVFAFKDDYIDLSFDGLNYSKPVNGGMDYNMPNKGWRSELNLTYGHRLRENIFIVAGFRQVEWEESLSVSADTNQRGSFVGVSLSNMEQGNTLISFSMAQFFGEFNSPEGSADAEGVLLRISWREKGSNDLWSLKWTQVGTLITDIPFTVGYTYLFY